MSEELKHPTTGQTVTEVARSMMKDGLSSARTQAGYLARYAGTQKHREFYAAVAASLSEG